MEENKQRRGREKMLEHCSERLRAALASASFFIGDTAREIVADFPWPTRLHTLLPNALVPSRSGFGDWKFREYDNWQGFCADVTAIPLDDCGYGYLYLGNDVPLFLVDFQVLAPLLGDLMCYLDANGRCNCDVACVSRDAGFILGRHTGYLSEEVGRGAVEHDTVFELCTWGVGALPR